MEKLAEEFGRNYKIKRDSNVPVLLGENWLNDYNISVINCNGKGNFEKYVKILKALEIPYFIVSDFDFLRRGLDNFLIKLKYDENLINTAKIIQENINEKIKNVNKNVEEILKNEVKKICR